MRDDEASDWRPLLEASPEDAESTGPVGFTKDHKGMHIQTSVDSNTGRLVKMDIASVAGACCGPSTAKAQPRHRSDRTNTNTPHLLTAVSGRTTGGSDVRLALLARMPLADWHRLHMLAVQTPHLRGGRAGLRCGPARDAVTAPCALFTLSRPPAHPK